MLAQAIVNEGNKSVVAGMNPMDLKRRNDKAVSTAVEFVKSMSVPCKDDKAIAQVGTISATILLLVKLLPKQCKKLEKKE